MADPGKKTTKFDMRSNPAIAAMQQCYVPNGNALLSEYEAYKKAGGQEKMGRPFTKLIDLGDKTAEQRSLIYRDRDPNLYDLWQELMGFYLHLADYHKMKITFSNTLNKFQYLFVVYGTWGSEEEYRRAGADMMKSAPQKGDAPLPQVGPPPKR